MRSAPSFRIRVLRGRLCTTELDLQSILTIVVMVGVVRKRCPAGRTRRNHLRNQLLTVHQKFGSPKKLESPFRFWESALILCASIASGRTNTLYSGTLIHYTRGRFRTGSRAWATLKRHQRRLTCIVKLVDLRDSPKPSDNLVARLGLAVIPAHHGEHDDADIVLAPEHSFHESESIRGEV